MKLRRAGSHTRELAGQATHPGSLAMHNAIQETAHHDIRHRTLILM